MRRPRFCTRSTRRRPLDLMDSAHWTTQRPSSRAGHAATSRSAGRITGLTRTAHRARHDASVPGTGGRGVSRSQPGAPEGRACRPQRLVRNRFGSTRATEQSLGALRAAWPSARVPAAREHAAQPKISLATRTVALTGEMTVCTAVDRTAHPAPIVDPMGYASAALRAPVRSCDPSPCYGRET